MNTQNTLSVAKKQNRWRFMINGTEVYSMNIQPFFGRALGWALDNQMKIAVDNLVVKQDNAINLVPNMATGFKKINHRSERVDSCGS